MTGPGSTSFTSSLEPPGPRSLLGESQLAVLRRYGTEHTVFEGELLFASGDQSYDMIVLLEGNVDIVDHFGEPDANVVITYGPREFLGEMGLLTGQGVYVTAVAATAGRMLRIATPQVKVIMSEEPDLSELILRAFLLRRARMTRLGSGPVLVGSRFDAETRRIIAVLARNRVSSRWLELESSPDAEALLRQLDVPVEELPIVVLPGGALLRNPTNASLLDALGLADANLSEKAEDCDLLVVGGGPAGLAAAVYGASEGLRTTLADGTALGGQAGTSSRIENYLGFPAGLSGDELTARAVLQAEKFGVRIKLGASAVSLHSNDGANEVSFDDGEKIASRSVIVATGARYNRLPLDRLGDFEGVGVYYAATQIEANACNGNRVAVVGGGNSAGQAALFLANTSRQVHIVIRAEGLASSMSRYLIRQIELRPNIDVINRTEVVGLIGDNTLAGIDILESGSQRISTLSVSGLFVFVGAKPATEWTGGQLAQDPHGFLLSGTDIPASRLERADQMPLALETSRPGVFCVGDVRSRSVKRVAAAIGEGSAAVRMVFERTEMAGLAATDPPRVS